MPRRGGRIARPEAATAFAGRGRAATGRRPGGRDAPSDGDDGAGHRAGAAAAEGPVPASEPGPRLSRTAEARRAEARACPAEPPAPARPQRAGTPAGVRPSRPLPGARHGVDRRRPWHRRVHGGRRGSGARAEDHSADGDVQRGARDHYRRGSVRRCPRIPRRRTRFRERAGHVHLGRASRHYPFCQQFTLCHCAGLRQASAETVRPVFTPRSSDGRRRQLLVLTAVLAVGAPICLLTSCRSSAQSAGAGAAGPPGAAGAPAAPGVAVAKASGPTASAPRSARKRSSALALTLMTDAARAAVRTSYQGEEIDSRWDTGGGTVLVSDILHVSGGQTVTQTLDTGTGGSAQPYTSSDLDGASPEGVLGVTTALVKMLETHYVVIYLGAASADNRAAQVVEAWRGDGSLAARFWLDSATKLPLEREVFDSAAHVISEGVFINIQIGKPAGVKASTSVKASTATGT